MPGLFKDRKLTKSPAAKRSIQHHTLLRRCV